MIAIFGYGIKCLADALFPWDNVPEMKWSEVVAARKGIFSPAIPFKNNVNLHKKYWQDMSSCLNEIGVVYENSGAGKFLLIKESIYPTTLNNSEEIYVAEIKEFPYIKWNKMLKDFFELVEYKNVAEFNWHLICYETTNK